MPIETAARVRNAGMPGRSNDCSAREADRSLSEAASADALDTTHFDTVRFPPPTWAITKFNAAFADGTAAYTPYRGNSALLAEVAKNVSSWMHQDIDPTSEIFFAPGSQAGLFSVLSAVVDPGDEVVLLDPDYLFSERILTFLDASIQRVALVASDEGSAAPDFAALEAAFARKPKLFMFSHPHNPTGTVFSRETLERVAELAVANDVVVLADELYARLVYPGVEYVHPRTLPGMRERTITLLGPSKTESLSGFRLGVVLAPPAIVRAAEDVLAMTALRAPAYAQHVLAGWLSEDVEWVDERITDLQKLRDMTVAAFAGLDWVKLTPGDGTAYVFPDVSVLGLPDSVVAERLRDDAGLLVSPGYQFGEHGAGHFRLCYARDESQWSAALDRVVTVLEALYAESQKLVTT